MTIKQKLLSFVLCCAAAASGGVDRTPKELLQFVTDARSMGLKDEEIKRGARNAGWHEVLINQALTAAPRTTGSVGHSGPRAMNVPPDYRIGAGDVLQIIVWKEPDASVPAVVVRADGKITVPLLKEVHVAGMTPAELEKMLAERLGQIVLGADVTVVPRDISSVKIYLLGGVRKEGPVLLTRTMTVLQAITEAGGLSEYAKRKKIYVLRNQNGKQVRLPFDYNAVIRGEHIEQNVMLMPDDTIVVPK